MTDTQVPTGISVSREKNRLTICFGPNEEYVFSAEYLRVLSPSAEVRGHSEAERKTVGGKRHVRIASISPVGNYAVKISYDDGHSTGIYSWEYFRDNGLNQNSIWAKYLCELAEKSMDRDTPQIL